VTLIQANNLQSVIDSPLQQEPVKKKVLYLDFIRVLAICLIVVFHFNVHAIQFGVIDSSIFWKNSLGIDHGFLGNLGVSLFIILSGASLMLSTTSGFDAKSFYKKRFLAIYPLFWLTYAVAFLILLLIHRALPVNAGPWTFILTIVGFDGFLLYAIPNFYLLGEWFLGFIIIMYFFFPFLRYLFLKYPLFAVLLCFCITLFIGKYYHPAMAIDRFPLFRIMEFMFGMSFVYIFNPTHKVLNILLCGMSGLLFYLSFPFGIPHPFGFVFQGLCIFILLSCIAELFDTVIFKRVIRFISVYSYGVFLIHHLVLIQVLPLIEGQHLSAFKSYSLFTAFLILVYTLSFFFTNAVAFGLRKFTAV
jgi:peptidoglycan/LPS O-acetylase OafA/YrhL